MANVAILIGEGYEDSEFQVPYNRLLNADHHVMVVGEKQGAVVHGKRGESEVRIQSTVDEIDEDELDALVIPGGHGPDKLRMNGAIVEFVRRFVTSGKPVAAICHGPQLLIEADVVKGKTLTSWPSVRKDLINAGAHWVDQSLVEDVNLITSRNPRDLVQFTDAIISRLQR